MWSHDRIWSLIVAEVGARQRAILRSRQLATITPTDSKEDRAYRAYLDQQHREHCEFPQPTATISSNTSTGVTITRIICFQVGMR